MGGAPLVMKQVLTRDLLPLGLPYAMLSFKVGCLHLLIHKRMDQTAFHVLFMNPPWDGGRVPILTWFYLVIFGLLGGIIRQNKPWGGPHRVTSYFCPPPLL